MSVEVIIPSLRQAEPERLVWSLAHQTHPPNVVSVISNEAVPFPSYGTNARLVRFSSSEYGVGDFDVALRQNVGIWSSECEVIIIQGDDQIAPPTMVEDALNALNGHWYAWGNHRLTDFATHTKEEVRELPRESGVTREDPTPPAWHGFHSCYGGMFAAMTGRLQEFGGFDMAFNGRHAGEDQALGFRLMRAEKEDHVWICEPPFSWHSIELKTGTSTRGSWLQPLTNGCGKGNHEFSSRMLNGISYMQCNRCPVWNFWDSPKLYRENVLIRYKPELVQTTSVWL